MSRVIGGNVKGDSRLRRVRAMGVAALSLVLAPALSSAGSQVTVVGADVRIEDVGAVPVPPGERDDVFRHILPMVGSSKLQESVARALGQPGLLGKGVVHAAGSEVGAAAAVGEIDHLVSGDADSFRGVQSEASIAVNPVNQNVVVAFAQNTGNVSGLEYACTAYVSANGGLTWIYGFDAPWVSAPNFCSNPVARFSPDGTALYLAYLDVDGTGMTSTLRINRRDGFNPLVDVSSVTLTADGNLIDKPWIDVHTFDDSGKPGPGPNAGYLYLTGTFFNNTTGDCDILYVQYTNYLASVGTVLTDLAHGNCSPPTPVSPGFRLVQGARAAGGPGNDVLVCWYDSGTDGWSTGAQLVPELGRPVLPLNRFNIACRSSDDNGTTFAGGAAPPEVTPGNWIYAARQVGFEVAFWLGPNARYFRYSAAQFPSVAIDHTGQAHIAFTFNPLAGGRFGPEQGAIGYVHTTGVPTAPRYSRWSARVVVATGYGAQFFPSVTAQRVWESPVPYIYIGYGDSARSLTLGSTRANAIYDVKYRLSTTSGTTFRAPLFVADHASVSDYLYIGDYIDSSANPGVYHLAWTDNRYAPSSLSPRTRIFADRY